MATTTIYARVPESTKLAAENYAVHHGMTLTGAVQELLGLGLEVVENEKSVLRMSNEVVELKEALHRVQTELQDESAAHSRTLWELESLKQAAEVWTQRAKIAVAKCPKCGESISGSDLLVAGQCSKCSNPTSVLMDSKTAGIESRDLMLVLGAVGVLLGLLVVSGSGN